MIVSFLRVKQSRRRLYFPIIQVAGSDLDDLAIDILAPLFRKDSQGHYFQFENYFRPLLDRIKNNPAESYIQLKRLISSHVNQELVDIFRKEDPDGWKLYRNIILAPQRNAAIHLIEVQQTRFLIYNDDPQIDVWMLMDCDKPEMDELGLMSLLKESMTQSKTTPGYLGIVLQALRNDDGVASQISLATLHSALKKSQAVVTFSMENEEHYGEENLLPLSKESIVERIKVHIQGQIDMVYRKPGKLSDEVLERYQSLLENYFEDLIWRGETDRLVRYMNHKPENDILKQEWKRHKSRLEYMIRKGREHLKYVFSQS